MEKVRCIFISVVMLPSFIYFCLKIGIKSASGNFTSLSEHLRTALNQKYYLKPLPNLTIFYLLKEYCPPEKLKIIFFNPRLNKQKMSLKFLAKKALKSKIARFSRQFFSPQEKLVFFSPKRI